MGEALSEKLDFAQPLQQFQKDQRPNNLEHLGQAMQEAGQTFGPDTGFGGALMKVAQTQMKLGASEREMVQTTVSQTLGPIRRFLEGDMKNIQVFCLHRESF